MWWPPRASISVVRIVSAIFILNVVIGVALAVYDKALAASGLDDSVVLLIHGNVGNNIVTSLRDSSFSDKTIVLNGDASSTSVHSKFGGTSVTFDGNGDYLSTPDSADLELGNSDFTIDFWVRPTSVSSGVIVIKRTSSIFAPFSIFFKSSGTLGLYSSASGNSWDVASNRTIATGLTTNAWYHVAFVRSGSTFYTFVNGIQTDSFTSSSTLYDNNQALLIGGDTASGGGGYFSGQVDEFRYSVGVARWISNFTPPTEAYGLGPAITLAGNAKFLRNIAVLDKLSKGSGTFVIDHPQKPRTHLLYHSFVESPEVKNLYDGIAQLDENGEAIIQLPDYFEALNKDFRYQYFPLDQSMPNLHVKEEVKNNQFVLGGGKPGGRVSWQITGIRHDPYIEANPVEVEVEKGPGELVDKGECLHEVACP